MNKRDEFSPKTKTAVALRASHRCSFPGCPQITAGPSDESPDAVAMVGQAAHIHGAASGPGSRRYLSSMTPEERMDIANAIWLCGTHATLIDRDGVTFMADDLREMKRTHEARCAELQRNAFLAGDPVADLVAIGPQIVCVGEFLGAERGELNFRLRSFVDGDIHALLAFVDHFQDIRPADRYILVDELGDGRVLSGPLSVKKEGSGGYTIQCPVLPSAARINASELPMDPALSDTHDLFVAGGDLATVSGFTALPQRLKICLSHQAGESRFSPDFGTRFGAYYRLLTGSPWFGHFLKLEVIRMAAIPYHDASLGGDQTPLRCVERVFAIDLLAGAPEKRWLPIRLDLQVKGVGRWQHELKVYIPDEPLESAAAAVTGARSRA